MQLWGKRVYVLTLTSDWKPVRIKQERWTGILGE